MYNYDNKELDKVVDNIIFGFFKETETEMVLLSDLGSIIKMEGAQQIDLTYNGKVRNINSYIRNTYNSLSNYIKKHDKLNLERVENQICVNIL
tara:strand:- start:263 stop:541 length:279 start_codon:yes stop_codon:yes gene_type:complete